MGKMDNEEASNQPWIVGLGEFLRQGQNTEAVLVDRVQKKVSVATLGQVDESVLRASLQQTLKAIQDAPEKYAQQKIYGVSIKPVSGQILLERNTPCQTAPRFWQWREIDWPEPDAHDEHDHDADEWRFLAILSGICAVAGVAGWMLQALAIGPAWLSVACYIVAIVAGGWEAAVDAMKNLRRGKLDIHFLMLAVALGAIVIGAYSEGALLLFLFSASGALEHFALYRTKREIHSLFEVAPKTACVIRADEQEVSVPIEQVKVGEVVLVRPGDVFPVDAEIMSGNTAADESNLTGEANPISKEVGDAVFSGTVNMWGAVRARVLRPASESTLQKIIRLIREAQHLKAPSQRFTDRFGTHYTIGVLSFTGLMFLLWWWVWDIPAFSHSVDGFSAFYRAMTLLVVASPCALVLSIPSAILAAIANGARSGVLFRGGAAIEKLSEVDVVALDKTGTLTTGELSVMKVESFPPGHAIEVAENAYALEKSSTHPIARAIAAYGKKEGLKLPQIADFKSITGHGVQGTLGAGKIVLGRRELLQEGPLAEWVNQLPPPAAEFTEVWLIQEGLLGRILLQDQIREESAPVLQALADLGITTVMLTGDHSETANDVGKRLGLQTVRAGLTPEGKVAAIRAYAERGHKVAMVGDGVNDAPSLAAAYVSVAMGARGSDAALEQSEVVLMKDRIDNFLYAYCLSYRSRGIIKQNIAISLGTIALMVFGAVGGWVPLSLGVLAHEGSTVLVCLNSLRLLLSSGSSCVPFYKSK